MTPSDAAKVVRSVLCRGLTHEQADQIVSAMVPVTLGALAGVGGGWLGSRALASLLFGVAPGDPATTAAVAAVVLLAGLVASVLPALRAARVQPGVVLRET